MDAVAVGFANRLHAAVERGGDGVLGFGRQVFAENIGVAHGVGPQHVMDDQYARRRVRSVGVLRPLCPQEALAVAVPSDRYRTRSAAGMRKRVGLARALALDPVLVMFDEPTAGLDPITAHTIMELIIKERDVDATTALVVTHRYQDGNLVANFRYNSQSGSLEPFREATSTRFMVMKEGKLIFEGDQDALEASADPYIGKFVKHAD